MLIEKKDLSCSVLVLVYKVEVTRLCHMMLKSFGVSVALLLSHIMLLEYGVEVKWYSVNVIQFEVEWCWCYTGLKSFELVNKNSYRFVGMKLYFLSCVNGVLN